jgi:hypothetical protein
MQRNAASIARRTRLWVTLLYVAQLVNLLKVFIAQCIVLSVRRFSEILIYFNKYIKNDSLLV